MPLQLLTETASLTKISHQGKHVYLEGLMLRANERNSNNRLYKRELLEAAVDAVQTKIRNGSAFSELGHSTTPEPQLDRVAGVLESLRQRGDTWYGRIKVIDEGAGRIARAIVRAGGTLGASSKGFGTTKGVNGIHEVQDGYSLCGVDIVSDPSCKEATLKAVTESIRNKQLSLHESAMAMRILAETAALDSVRRPDGSSSPM